MEVNIIIRVWTNQAAPNFLTLFVCIKSLYVYTSIYIYTNTFTCASLAIHMGTYVLHVYPLRKWKWKYICIPFSLSLSINKYRQIHACICVVCMWVCLYTNIFFAFSKNTVGNCCFCVIVQLLNGNKCAFIIHIYKCVYICTIYIHI